MERKIIEYEDKYLEDVKDLLVELEEYILTIDKDNLDQLHPEYREKMAVLDLKKVSKVFLFLLILGFLALFFAYSNGYYERMQGEKVNLTNQMIEQFEKDIQAGLDVSLESYLQEEKDYSSKTSKTSLNISEKLENTVDSVIKFIFKKIGEMVE